MLSEFGKNPAALAAQRLLCAAYLSLHSAGTAASCARRSELCVLTSVRKLILKPVVLLVLGCPLFR